MRSATAVARHVRRVAARPRLWQPAHPSLTALRSFHSRARLSKDASITASSSTTTTSTTTSTNAQQKERVDWQKWEVEASTDKPSGAQETTRVRVSGGSVTLNPLPTESEEDVRADKSEVDPLVEVLHKEAKLPAGGAVPLATESEEDVKADRSPEDPLRPLKQQTR